MTETEGKTAETETARPAEAIPAEIAKPAEAPKHPVYDKAKAVTKTAAKAAYDKTKTGLSTEKAKRFWPYLGWARFKKDRQESEKALKELYTEAPGNVIIPDGALESKLEEEFEKLGKEVAPTGKTEEETARILVNRCTNVALIRAQEHFEKKAKAQAEYNRTHGKWAWFKYVGPQLLYASTIVEALGLPGLWNGMTYIAKKVDKAIHWMTTEEYQRKYSEDKKIHLDAKLKNDNTWYAAEDIPANQRQDIEKMRLTVPKGQPEGDTHVEVSSQGLADEVNMLVKMAELNDASRGVDVAKTYSPTGMNNFITAVRIIDGKAEDISREDMREAWKRFAKDGNLQSLGLVYDK